MRLMETINRFRCSKCGVAYDNLIVCSRHEDKCLELRPGVKVIFKHKGKRVPGTAEVTDYQKDHRDGHDRDIAAKVHIVAEKPFAGSTPSGNGFRAWIPWKNVIQILD